MANKKEKKEKKETPVAAPSETKLNGLTDAQVEQIGTYLISRPYHEVEKLVVILRNAPVINVTVAPQPSPVEPETPAS